MNVLTVFFALLGSAQVKASCKMLVKSTPNIGLGLCSVSKVGKQESIEACSGDLVDVKQV